MLRSISNRRLNHVNSLNRNKNNIRYMSSKTLFLPSLSQLYSTTRLRSTNHLHSITKLNNNVRFQSNMRMNLSQPQSGDTLKQYSVDLTDLAKSGKLDPVLGRDSEIKRTIQILSRRQKSNPILLGPPGVGKYICN